MTDHTADTADDEQSGFIAPTPRPSLADVPSYVPNAPTARPQGVSHRLFLNENPYPPLPSALDAVVRASQSVNRYPAIAPQRLVRRLADLHELSPAMIATGPGSVGIYQQIGQAFVRSGSEVVFAWPSFEAFPIVARVAGAIPIAVPLRDHRHDLDAIAGAIGPRTSAVFLCNPDNPTGTAFGRTELLQFLDVVPRDVLVVVDDAYHEFAGSDPELSADAVAVARDRPNVVALRTFSKAYSLAGLRVGYAVAAVPIAEALGKCAVPSAVTELAVDAALASLDAPAELAARRDLVTAERERLTAGLLGLGWPVVASVTNFVWLPLGAAAEGVARSLESAGVLVRCLPGQGVRISVGLPEATDRLLAVVAGLPTPVHPSPRREPVGSNTGHPAGRG